MKNIKVAFIDIDGTLTNSKKIITPHTIEVLSKATYKGIDIVLCSGRTNAYVYDFAAQIPNTRYIISSNGAEIFDYINKCDIYANLLPFNCVEKIWNYAMENSIGCILNTNTIRYGNMHLKTITDSNKIIVDNINSLNKTNIYQIVIDSTNYLKMERIKEFIERETSFKIINCSSSFLNRDVNANSYFFDITTQNTNKGNAIKAFLTHKGLSKENAICFGDGVNDYDMFKSCGTKVAMDNALSELKEKADFITSSNNDDGVANFFEKYILNL